MAWTKEQIEDHKLAANKLDQVMQAAFGYIKLHQKNVTEREVQEFILSQFKKEELKTDKDRPIVAFGKNTSFVHYYPEKESAKLDLESLILIDIWARLDKKSAPFADITWMAYCGQSLPKNIQKTFDAVKLASSKAISFIENTLKKLEIPKGSQIDAKVRQVLNKYNFEQYFLHGTGHSLGFVSAHGRLGSNIRRKTNKKISQNIGYTIEPGVYFKNDFGIRLEIDFIIDEKFNLVLTAKKQGKIIKI